MNDNTHPAELVKTLACMDLSDLLETYVAPERVKRWGFLSVERYVAQHGYTFERRGGNIYDWCPRPPLRPRSCA